MRKTEKTQSLTPLIQRQRGAEWIVKILKCPGDLEKKCKSSKPWTVVLIKLARWKKRYNISSWLVTVQQKITSLINLQRLHCASFLSAHPLPTKTFNRGESSPLLYRNLSDFWGEGKGTCT